ncbi:MAG: hypothetical protein SPK09_06040, partial [Porphyromonas sp.]|nr:hypothetical protein [Porphyromonas sp.]
MSSTPGAKVLKDLDSAIAEYENKSSNPRTFIGDLARALGASRHGSLSQYATFETMGGKVVTIRLSNHNAKVSNFDNAGEDHGISIVITGKPNNGLTDDGWAHVEEYFYQEQTLKRAEGKPLVEILKGIKHFASIDEVTDRVLYDLVHGTDLGVVKPAEMVSIASETDNKLKVSSLPLDTELPVVEIGGSDVSYAEAKAVIKELPSTITTADGYKLQVSKRSRQKLGNILLISKEDTITRSVVSRIQDAVRGSVLLEEHRDRIKVDDKREAKNPSNPNTEKVQR